MPASRGTHRGRKSQPGRAVARQRTPWLPIAIGVVVVLGLVAAVLAYSRSSANSSGAASTPSPSSGGASGSGSIEGVMTFSGLARDHVNGHVDYPQTPPTGGPHNPVWLNCGIYDKPVPNENAVHSLEHGAVWITYAPDLPAAAVAQLRGLVRGHAYAILSPYEGLPAPVVASAWGVQLRASGADDPRLPQFIKAYEQGPQTPEPGAPCSGGRGVPIVG